MSGFNINCRLYYFMSVDILWLCLNMIGQLKKKNKPGSGLPILLQIEVTEINFSAELLPH